MSDDFETRSNNSRKEHDKGNLWIGLDIIPSAIIFLDFLDAAKGATTPIGGNTGAIVTLASFVLCGIMALSHYCASDKAKRGSPLNGSRNKPIEIHNTTCCEPVDIRDPINDVNYNASGISQSRYQI
jgi:hypothetical protein